MKITMLAHGNTDPEKVMLMYKTVKFYAGYLKLLKSKYTLYVCSAPNLRKLQGNNGVCSRTNDREITVAVDSTLEFAQLCLTLAHEMVHVKQLVRGQYKSEVARNGRMKRMWLGKQYSVAYLKRPWEREAFRREGELFDNLIQHIAQKVKKQQSLI